MTETPTLIERLNDELETANAAYTPARTASTLASLRILAAHARDYNPAVAWFTLDQSDQGPFMSLCESRVHAADGTDLSYLDDEATSWEEYLDDHEDADLETIAWNLDTYDDTWRTYLAELPPVEARTGDDRRGSVYALDAARILADYDAEAAESEDRSLDGWQHPDHLPGITVTTFIATGEDTLDDGAKVIQIDTTTDAGRVRINLNDGPPVWDGNPETGEPGDVDALIEAAKAALARVADAATDPAAARALADLRNAAEVALRQADLPRLTVRQAGPNPNLVGRWPTWDAEAEMDLADALAAFAAAGGRGVDLAGRIDTLTRARAVAEGRCPSPHVYDETHEYDENGVCKGCGAGAVVLVCPACDQECSVEAIDTMDDVMEQDDEHPPTMNGKELSFQDGDDYGGDRESLCMQTMCCRIPVRAPEGWEASW